MHISRRAGVSILVISIILLSGLFFWPVILNEIITPISLVIWLLLRMFVLSIGQQYYWAAIILVVLFFLFRLLPQDQTHLQVNDFLNSNAAIPAQFAKHTIPNPLRDLEAGSAVTNIAHWRSLFTLTSADAQDTTALKRELIRLLLSFYASKQRTSANFGLYEALQRGDMLLPNHIHLFLFPDEPKKPGRAIKRLLQAIQNTPRKWIRRWTGQEAAEYYQMIDEVLSFIETSLSSAGPETTLEMKKQ